MLSAVSLLGAGAGLALVISGALVRRAMQRNEVLLDTDRMPPGGAHEGS